MDFSTVGKIFSQFCCNQVISLGSSLLENHNKEGGEFKASFMAAAKIEKSFLVMNPWNIQRNINYKKR